MVVLLVLDRSGTSGALRSPPRRTGRRGSTPITENSPAHRSVVRDPGVCLYLALQNGVWRWRLGRWSSQRRRPDLTSYSGHLDYGRTSATPEPSTTSASRSTPGSG